MVEKESTAGSPLRVYRRGCTTGPAPKTQSGLITHRGSDKGPSPSPILDVLSQKSYLAIAKNWKLSKDIKERLMIRQVVAIIEFGQETTIT